MPGLLSDVNIDGQMKCLHTRLVTGPFREEWLALGIAFLDFADVRWDRALPDDQVWTRCQENDLMLITDNRNGHGPNSLEVTIRKHGGPGHWPVFTISRSEHLLRSRAYVDRVAERLMEFLIDCEACRGTGRLYLP